MTTTSEPNDPCEPCEASQRPKFEWRLLGGAERSNGDGVLGVKIMVLTQRDLTDNDRRAGYKAIRDLDAALDMETARLDPKTEDDRVREKADIEKVFVDAGFPVIFMEPIPNEYFGPNDPWSLRSPWYVITTPIGHIKIGWRKRVLALDWSRSTVKVAVDTLFPSEDVTKGDHMIHAWSYAKATEYLTKLRTETTKSD